jgi:hypothetical protein
MPTSPKIKSLQELEHFLKTDYINITSLEGRGVLSDTLYRLFKKLPKSIRRAKLNKEIKDGLFEDMSITKNDFPYNKLLSELKANHWIVWQTNETKDFGVDNVKLVFERFLISKGIKPEWIIVHKNNFKQKSIKDIDHFQVFWK